jgi:hypothetical protein
VWVHQLVCEAFHGPRPTSEHQVRHLDGNRLNNHATNLAWGTREENDADRKLHGDLAGEQNSSAKLTEGQVKEIRERYAAGGIFQRELAAEYGVSQTNVSRILRRDNWQHI